MRNSIIYSNLFYFLKGFVLEEKFGVLNFHLFTTSGKFAIKSWNISHVFEASFFVGTFEPIFAFAFCQHIHIAENGLYDADIFSDIFYAIVNFRGK